MIFKRIWIAACAGVLIFAALTSVHLSFAEADAAQVISAFIPVVSRAPTPTPVATPYVPPNPYRLGSATWYYATGGGACSFPESPQDMMVAAANSYDYGSSALCGSYVRVWGPKGSVIVRIVDLCPGCGVGDLDLSREAFARIANLSQGRVPIEWQVVSPEIDGPIAYHFSSGSNRWWTAVQVRNHRNPVARFVWRNGAGEWVAVPRMSWNYFVQTEPGMGPGPYAFRVTDVYGHVLVDEGVPLTPGGTVEGDAQFPPGP